MTVRRYRIGPFVAPWEQRLFQIKKLSPEEQVPGVQHGPPQAVAYGAPLAIKELEVPPTVRVAHYGHSEPRSSSAVHQVRTVTLADSLLHGLKDIELDFG